MIRSVDLILLGESQDSFGWPLGETHVAAPTPKAIHRALHEIIQHSDAEAVLMWDSRLGAPNVAAVIATLDKPGDVWHAGLRLGLAGKPELLDFVKPTWTLNRDPSPDIEASSWRMSLRACLARLEVFRQLGNINPAFQTLAGASLELGYRFILRGAFMRHVPSLVSDQSTLMDLPPTVQDELTFVSLHFGPFWKLWTVLRAGMSGLVSFGDVGTCLQTIVARNYALPPAFRRDTGVKAPFPVDPKVTVLIPTLQRYPYLRKVLSQLRDQSVRPHEIIVVDQTPLEERDNDIATDFADLPLKLYHLDEPGQCSSRNYGLQQSSGDYILFLDDDDEIQPSLIESHLNSLAWTRADVSSGVAHDVDAGPLPEQFKLMRLSDVFPTNNSLIKREVLSRSGLFDLAYERGQRADADLGMRIYLSGALMVLNPAIAVLHHHAPRGGLRAHGARVITYASSRASLTQRHLPSVTEIYLAMRYFSSRQVKEMLSIRTLSTLSIHGTKTKKLVKAIIGLGLLPHTVSITKKRVGEARRALKTFPKIPTLRRTEPGIGMSVAITADRREF